MASIYRQPFAAFFLPTPPEVFKPPVHDYRRLPDDHATPISSELLLEFRAALDRRSICLELYADRGRTPPQFNEKADVKRDDELRQLAKDFGVSREVVLRRILILGRTSEAFYERRHRQFQTEYERPEREKSFLSPARDAVSSAGRPFVSLVLDAFNDDRITTSDVSDFLGVRLKHLDKISEILGMS
ncbi:MAG TPA: hypothetical protein PK867_23780 [Pirellulales bacterium]|nr:hypothetical protein [Pirellulales bacterium]